MEELRQVGTKPFDDDARQELTIEVGETLEATVEKGGLAVFQSPEGRQTLFYRVGIYWITVREESPASTRENGFPDNATLRIRADPPPQPTGPKVGRRAAWTAYVPGGHFGVFVSYAVALRPPTAGGPSLFRENPKFPEGEPLPADAPWCQPEERQAAAELAAWIWHEAQAVETKAGITQQP